MFDQAFWVLIAFVIFVSISFRSAKKLIISALDRRTEEIKKRLQEAENIRNEAKEIVDVNIKKLETAKKEVTTILSEANKEAEMQKKKALENLNNSMERNKDQLQDRIQKNEKETIEKLKRIISTISISASESFLKNNIDEKLHNRLIENSLSELPKKIQ
ncbi:MAG: hypothetical protein MKZ73_04555 [Alphaproteobacteria bacterium]|jgi:F-type H+-transporting ATPase subunit b|nr:hypothetical protein [Alphaproteobacteria bacterium]